MEPMKSTSTLVASYPEYVEAQYAVDALSDHRFPVERLAIVGSGLESVEKVTGRRGYWQAGIGGLLSGAVVGALLGWLLGLFSLVQPLVSALLLGGWGLLIGGVIGLLLGLAGHAATGGRRDFSSVSTVRADHYDVVADPEVAEEAKRALAETETEPSLSR
jgi:hypothetical protein